VPLLTRWYVKTAIVYLVMALLLGVVLAGSPFVRLPAAVVLGAPAQIHLFVVGWLTQLIFGIAYWMFPKASADRPRGSDRLAILTYVALNLGLLSRAVGEPWNSVRPGVAPAVLLVCAGLLQWGAGLGFAVAAWPRVRGR
jgi:hypothetical protein